MRLSEVVFNVSCINVEIFNGATATLAVASAVATGTHQNTKAVSQIFDVE